MMNKFKHPVHPKALGRLVSDIFNEQHHFIVVVNFAPSVLSRIASGKSLLR